METWLVTHTHPPQSPLHPGCLKILLLPCALIGQGACCFLSFMSINEEFETEPNNETSPVSSSTPSLPFSLLPTTAYTTKRMAVFTFAAAMTNSHEQVQVLFGGMGCGRGMRWDLKGNRTGGVQYLRQNCSHLLFSPKSPTPALIC